MLRAVLPATRNLKPRFNVLIESAVEASAWDASPAKVSVHLNCYEKVFKNIFEKHKRNADHQCAGRKSQGKIYRHMDGCCVR